MWSGFLIVCCLIFGCGSTATNSPSDGAGNDDGGGGGSAGSDAQTSPDTGVPDGAQTGGDGPIRACSDVPYPTLLMCSVPMQICRPTSGYDCCRCLPGNGCGADYVWLCQNSNAGCPTLPPTVGTACTLPNNSGCIYCTSPAVNVACSGGTWASVGAEVFCSP